MPNPYTPCGQATPQTALQPFGGWPACRAGGLWPSSSPLDTPSRTGLLMTIHSPSTQSWNPPSSSDFSACCPLLATSSSMIWIILSKPMSCTLAGWAGWQGGPKFVNMGENELIEYNPGRRWPPAERTVRVPPGPGHIDNQCRCQCEGPPVWRPCERSFFAQRGGCLIRPSEAQTSFIEVRPLWLTWQARVVGGQHPAWVLAIRVFQTKCCYFFSGLEM
jgi:hypothetical protein